MVYVQTSLKNIINVMSKVKPEDLEGIMGIDVVQQIESALVDEISKSIDKEIIKNIFNLNKKNWKRKESIEKIFKFSE